MSTLREQYERETGENAQTNGGVLYQPGYVAWLERRAASAEQLAAALQEIARTWDIEVPRAALAAHEAACKEKS